MFLRHLVIGFLYAFETDDLWIARVDLILNIDFEMIDPKTISGALHLFIKDPSVFGLCSLKMFSLLA